MVCGQWAATEPSLRHEAKSRPVAQRRSWAAALAGMTMLDMMPRGIVPLWWDVEATAYVSEGGHLVARLRTFYNVLITQRLILEPELELDF